MTEFNRAGKSSRGHIHTKIRIENPGDRPTEIKIDATGPEKEIQKLASEL